MYPYQQGFNGQQQQQQQQLPMQLQRTGYGNFNAPQSGFMPPQLTGFNMQQVQPQQFQNQPTGMYGNAMAGGFGNAPQPLYQQLTGFYPQQQQQLPQPQQQQQLMMFQQTGLPQNSMGLGQQQQQFNEVENTELRIPNVRISFITLEDQKKFEHLFRISVPRGENAIDGATAREILMKSNIPASQLAEIWKLSDTTRSGKLLFPEFALALHLCNVVLKGESLPFELPHAMKNEVTNFVDNINFYVPDDGNSLSNNNNRQSIQPQQTGYAPQSNGFGGMSMQPQQTGFQPAPLQPLATGFNMAPLQQQRTGFNAPLQPQRTGFNAPLQPQATGLVTLQPQRTGFNAPLQPQATGLVPLQPQRTGFNNAPLQPQATGLVPLQPQRTGFNAPLQPQATGLVPLQPQRTGFNAPLQPQATGFNGSALQPQATGFNNMSVQPQGTGMPLNPQRTGAGLVPQQTGFTSVLSNPTGILPQQTGFSQLPPMPTGQLLPQKTGGLTNFFNTVSEAPVLKSTEWAITPQERSTFEKIFKNISQQGFISGQQAIQVLSKSGLARTDLEKIWNLSDINNRGKLNKDEFSVAMHLIYRRLSGMDIPAFLPTELIPPSTKVLDDVKMSLKNQNSFGKKPSKFSSSISNNFKNDDEDSGIYVSRNRRKANGSSSDKVEEPSESSDVTIAQLKKTIQEKKIILSAIDARDEDRSTDTYAKQKLANEIETLKIKIKDAHTKLVNASSVPSIQQKQQLLQRLRSSTDKLPFLMSELESLDTQIGNAKIDLFKAKLQKESPSIKFFASDEERARAKSRFLIKQRMASLTGKPAPSAEGFEDGETRLESEKEKINKETQAQLTTMKEIETSIKSIADAVSKQLESSNTAQVSYLKYEQGDGLSSQEVRQFIDMLKAIKPIAQPVTHTSQYSLPTTQSYQPQTPTQVDSSRSATTVSSPQSTGVDRAAYIKQQAQDRMNARLAKLGIKRGNTTRSPTVDAPLSPALSPAPTPAQAPASVPAVVPSPIPDTPVKEVSQPPPAPAARRTTSTLSSPAVVVPKLSEDSSDDEDDLELSKLLAEKARLEEEEKERHRKRAERKAEIARLKAEMEAIKNKGDASDDEDTAPASAPKLIAAPALEPQQNSTAHSYNPFYNPGTTTPISTAPLEALLPAPVAPSAPALAASAAVQKTNPFFKPDVSRTSSASSQQVPAFDKGAAEAQRRAQRGQSNGDDDDDWGDELASEEDEEDAIPLRGPAHLASLLFGGGSVPTHVPQAESPVPKSEPVASPPVPQAEPIATPAVPEPQVAEAAPVEKSIDPAPLSSTTANTSDLDDDFTTPPLTSPVLDLQPEILPPPIPNGFSAPIPPLEELLTPQVDSMPPIPSAFAPPIPAAEELPVSNGYDLSIPQVDSLPLAPTDDAPLPPPLPKGFAPPVPTDEAPSLNGSEVSAPPLPNGFAPSVPLTSNGFAAPETSAPPPPPMPTDLAPLAAPLGIPPPPPPMPAMGIPPPPPPPAGDFSGAPSAPAPAPLAGGIAALLGEIQGGKSLRKVDESEKHHVNSASVGKVL